MAYALCGNVSYAEVLLRQRKRVGLFLEGYLRTQAAITPILFPHEEQRRVIV